MKKNLVVGILCAALSISMVGCGSASNESENVNVATSEEVTNDVTDDGSSVSETKDEVEEVNDEIVDEESLDESEDVVENTEDSKQEEDNMKSEEVVLTQKELVNMTPVDFAALLKFGWNLGNTLDANSVGGLESETCWNQPVTTQELISYVKSVGFTSIRIPVSWGKHVDDEYNIDEEWMARVKEVVDYAYNENMYVIITSHHDNDFYYPSDENYDNAEKYLTTIWEQIAKEFEDYDNHLIFESMNEPRLSGTDIEWWFAMSDLKGKAAIEKICKLNQAFVDTIRSAEGNNKDRFLLVPSYAANVDFAFFNVFSMPEDPAGKMMLSVHAYTPYDFAGNANGYSDWDGSKNYEFNFMGKLKALFINEGYGVVIGEFGATNKGNDKARITWAKNYTQKAASFGIPCFVWDNGAVGVGEENFGVIDRTNLKLYFPEIFDAYMSGYPE